MALNMDQKCPKTPNFFSNPNLNTTDTFDQLLEMSTSILTLNQRKMEAAFCGLPLLEEIIRILLS